MPKSQAASAFDFCPLNTHSIACNFRRLICTLIPSQNSLASQAALGSSISHALARGFLPRLLAAEAPHDLEAYMPFAALVSPY
jgi:hypothetical protein